MALDKTKLTNALKAAFEAGMGDENWTLTQAAAAMADAIDSYVRDGEVMGVTTNVTDPGNNPIGTGVQSAPVKLA
ncbi:MAG TPA: hypothetical protein VF759_10370 [Allosphingosinicella sp.]|jgi:hypothetical protein